MVPNPSLSCFQVSFTGCFAALELHHGHKARAGALLHTIPRLNVGRMRSHAAMRQSTGELRKYPRLQDVIRIRSWEKS